MASSSFIFGFAMGNKCMASSSFILGFAMGTSSSFILVA
jgi:hypothetical protein